MVIFLLAVLPLADLDSPSFAKRSRARQQIMRTGTVDEIDTAFKDDLSCEQRESLKWCRNRLRERWTQQQVESLAKGNESRLPGWQDAKEIIGEDAEAREFYLWLWMNHRAEIERYYAAPIAERSGVAIGWSSKLSYYDHSEAALGCLFACISKQPYAVERCCFYLEYSGEGEVLYLPYSAVFQRIQSKLKELQRYGTANRISGHGIGVNSPQ